MIVETDGFKVEAPVNGCKDIPVISKEAQVISPEDVPTIQKQQTDEAKDNKEKINPPHPNKDPKVDEEVPCTQQPVS